MDFRRTTRVLARTAVAVALGMGSTVALAGPAAADHPRPTPTPMPCTAEISEIKAVLGKSTTFHNEVDDGAQIVKPIPSGSLVTITFKVVDDPEVAQKCVSATFSLATYRADLALLGAGEWDEFLSTQQFFDGRSKTLRLGETSTLTVRVPAVSSSAPTGDGCTNKFLTNQFADRYNGNGGSAEDGNEYASTCNGRESLNGNGGGNANGRPCQGCVGNADNKNPKGQRPNGTDANNGYECDGNNGIGKGNPAHTDCAPHIGWQLDFYQGPLLKTLTADGHDAYNQYALQIGGSQP